MVEDGERDRRVALRRLVETTGRGNSPVASWSTLATVWAKRTPVRDLERLAASAQQVQATHTDRFVVAWSRVAASLTVRDRLLCEGAEFEISATKEIGRREGLEITATRRKDGGGL